MSSQSVKPGGEWPGAGLGGLSPVPGGTRLPLMWQVAFSEENAGIGRGRGAQSWRREAGTGRAARPWGASHS